MVHSLLSVTTGGRRTSGGPPFRDGTRGHVVVAVEDHVRPTTPATRSAFGVQEPRVRSVMGPNPNHGVDPQHLSHA